MKASQIAHEAAKLLDGDRDRTHGNKRDNHANIGALWSAYLSRALGVHVALRPSQVAALMVLLKVGRTLAGAHNADDAVDAVGYSAIMGELAAASKTLTAASILPYFLPHAASTV